MPTSSQPRGRHPKSPQGRGEIRADALYPIAVLLRRLGISRNSLASMRRRGMPVRFIGRRCGACGWRRIDRLPTSRMEKRSGGERRSRIRPHRNKFSRGYSLSTEGPRWANPILAAGPRPSSISNRAN